MDILMALWAMFTNNGMYSTEETVIIIVAAIIGTIAFERYQLHKVREEKRADIIAALGYDGYLRHKELMQKLGRPIDY